MTLSMPLSKRAVIAGPLCWATVLRRRRKQRLKRIVAIYLYITQTTPRRQFQARVRMVWAERVASLTARQFVARYRLDLGGFDYLLAEINRDGALWQYRANVKDQIRPELLLSMFLRWAAGGSYLDICDLHGVAESTFYAHLWHTARCIDDAFQFPLVEMINHCADGDVELAAAEFDTKSGGTFRGCIGCIDGLQVKIEAPVYQAARYFCRKGFYALNAQMACDSHRRIIWCSTLCCGSTHDSAALNLSELGRILADDSHPIQAMFYWLAGDDAYKGPANNTCSLLTPYDCAGDDAEKKKQDDFNAWLSICRINIECAFGMLVWRWGILHRCLNHPRHVEHSTLLVHVLAKLHNIACDRKIPVSNTTRPCKMDSYRGRVPGRGGGDLVGRDWAEWRIPNKYFDPQDTNRGRPGTRQPLRDELADRLKFASLGRPKRSQYVGYERDPRPASD